MYVGVWQPWPQKARIDDPLSGQDQRRLSKVGQGGLEFTNVCGCLGALPPEGTHHGDLFPGPGHHRFECSMGKGGFVHADVWVSGSHPWDPAYVSAAEYICIAIWTDSPYLMLLSPGA